MQIHLKKLRELDKEAIFQNSLTVFDTFDKSTLGSFKSRGEQKIPKLAYVNTGKFTHIENGAELCRYTARSLKLLSGFFASRLGSSYEVKENLVILNGSFKQLRLKQIENQFYNQQILCRYCKGPDTKREGALIICSICGKRYDTLS